MSPLAIINAIFFGSAVAISFGLCGVLVIFLFLKDESGQVGVEIGRLPYYCLGFLALSGISGAALYSLMKNLSWRWKAQAAMWVALMIVAVLVSLR